MLMIRCRVCLFSTLFVTMFATLGVAQDLPSQQEHIAGLEPFMGSWQGELSNGATMNVWVRWASNNSFAQFQFFVRDEDERTHIGTLVVGYSGENEKVSMWGFWPDQVIQGVVTEAKEGALAYRSEGVSADGTKVSAEATWKAEGDEVTIQVTNRRRGGEEEPDINLTLKRQERRLRRQN